MPYAMNIFQYSANLLIVAKPLSNVNVIPNVTVTVTSLCNTILVNLNIYNFVSVEFNSWRTIGSRVKAIVGIF